ncbi:Flp family type IVb pilin [Tundrisphaera lichenicola]|uniref:Flp family type IVb pilin n=1 Tax=Tundrisphaera lichenicola TaxID=2029860 RepID=UPI003EBEFFBA
MSRHIGAVRRFCSDESAATMAEYVLMVALIGLACLTAVASLGEALRPLFLGAVDGLS